MCDFINNRILESHICNFPKHSHFYFASSHFDIHATLVLSTLGNKDNPKFVTLLSFSQRISPCSHPSVTLYTPLFNMTTWLDADLRLYRCKIRALFIPFEVKFHGLGFSLHDITFVVNLHRHQTPTFSLPIITLINI